MDDLIRRQDVLDKAYELDLSDTGNDIQIMVVDVEDIEALPSVNVKPMVKGEWISYEDRNSIYGHVTCYCSECGHVSIFKENFCMGCGADMKEVNNNG